MAYTVSILAQLSGVSVRTLHWYDEIDLLKPAFVGDNGYRYYEEAELLRLQQVLFFRELGFDLKEIQRLLDRPDFDQKVALRLHRQKLLKRMERIRSLVKTIDKTIKHIEGERQMKETEYYFGFVTKEKQDEYEKMLIDRFGEKGKKTIQETKEKVKEWSKADWARSQKEFDLIAKELTKKLKDGEQANSIGVQDLIRRHHEWLKSYWTPTRETYKAHAEVILETDLRKAYEAYDSHLPEFIAEAIRLFSKRQLQG